MPQIQHQCLAVLWALPVSATTRYHRAGDLVDRAEYDTEQLTFVSRAALAAAAVIADMQL